MTKSLAARHHESAASTYSKRLPIVPVEGRGARLRDATGRWYVDCLAAAGAMSLGWNHPVVNEAVRQALSSGAPLLSLDFHTPARDAFVEQLLTTLPPSLANDCVVHLCSPSGANAVEAALMLAEIATGGHEHVAVQGGFHGCSRAARSVSTGAGMRGTGGQLTAPVHFLPFPQQYRCPFGVGGEQGTELAIRAVDTVFTDPHGGLGSPASVITEFVLGEGGVLPAPGRWARALRSAASRADIPLIADEVQAGVYRTGPAWAFQRCGVEPDLIAISKGLGSGMPIAVLVVRRKFDLWQPGAFTGTFRGNTLAFAAATAVLRFADEERLGERVATVGAVFDDGLKSIMRDSAIIGEVRAAGLMLGVEIVSPDADPDDRGVRAPDAHLARQVQQECLNAGLIVETGGRYDNVIRFLPPLTVEEADVAAALDAFATAISCAQRRWPARSAVRA